MSQVINFPTSMNLSAVKETAEPTMKGDFIVFGSSNQEYGAGQTIKIDIANVANTWLHGNDSFLSFRAKINATTQAGSIALDGNCYSMFKNARLINAGSVLVEQNECGRLWNALFDLQVSASDRASKEITHGIQEDLQFDFASGLFGATITDGKYLYFCIPLPMSIVGTLSEKSFPLGALNKHLQLELDVQDLNKMLTTRTGVDSTLGAQSAASTALTLTKIVIDEVYYHAKVSNVGIYNNILMSALGPSIVIPGTEYRHDYKEVPASTNALTVNFSYPLKSAKSLLFWFTNTATATGAITNNKLNSATTQRCAGGNLKSYYVTINGVAFPSTAIDASAGKDLQYNVRTGINGAIPFQQLLRCFNLNSSTSGGGVLSHHLYNSATASWADDASTKRFIAGIDLDRGSNDGDKYFQGINVQNTTLAVRVEWNVPAAEAITLYTYVMHDVGFVISDGVCKVSM